jgi:hypothetical protein
MAAAELTRSDSLRSAPESVGSYTSSLIPDGFLPPGLASERPPSRAIPQAGATRRTIARRDLGTITTYDATSQNEGVNKGLFWGHLTDEDEEDDPEDSGEAPTTSEEEYDFEYYEYDQPIDTDTPAYRARRRMSSSSFMLDLPVAEIGFEVGMIFDQEAFERQLESVGYTPDLERVPSCTVARTFKAPTPSRIPANKALSSTPSPPRYGTGTPHGMSDPSSLSSTGAFQSRFSNISATSTAATSVFSEGDEKEKEKEKESAVGDYFSIPVRKDRKKRSKILLGGEVGGDGDAADGWDGMPGKRMESIEEVICFPCVVNLDSEDALITGGNDKRYGKGGDPMGESSGSGYQPIWNDHRWTPQFEEEPAPDDPIDLDTNLPNPWDALDLDHSSIPQPCPSLGTSSSPDVPKRVVRRFQALEKRKELGADSWGDCYPLPTPGSVRCSCSCASTPSANRSGEALEDAMDAMDVDMEYPASPTAPTEPVKLARPVPKRVVSFGKLERKADEELKKMRQPPRVHFDSAAFNPPSKR